jgi:hypothetical protein
MLQTPSKEPFLQRFPCLNRHVLEAGNTVSGCKRCPIGEASSGPVAIIPALDVASAESPQAFAERIAEEALAGALRRLCRGGSWQGIARELAWRAVTGGHRDARMVEPFAERAEAMLAPLVDQALWRVERHVATAREEYLELRPRDDAGARAAARLDAEEEAERLVQDAYGQVLDSLLDQSKRAA